MAEPDVGECAFDGATIPAVIGPFPPTDFHTFAAGRKNPGARLAVSEHDMDLVAVKGAPGAPEGQVVVIRGQLIAPNCEPLVGAHVKLWQADHYGHYNHEHERTSVMKTDLDASFGYWGSTQTDGEGRFVLKTVVPGSYPASGDWWRPPHLHWTLSAKGMKPVTTQTYFDGDLLDGIDKIRKQMAIDYIVNMTRGFEEGFSGKGLEQARQRVLAEQVAKFAKGDDGLPTGSLTFRLAT